MSSQWMTIIAAIVAMLGVVNKRMPADTPEWAGIIVEALIAGLVIVGGVTHPGIGKKKNAGKT